MKRMTTRASATFEIKAWDEKPYAEFEGGRKLTRASVNKTIHGDIEGESSVEYLMAYGTDGSAYFVGMEHVIGRIGDRSGSFVLQHSGTFAGGIANETWFVVPGSGTGELGGLRGEGGAATGHAQPSSTVHVLEQPSPAPVLWSSQPSVGVRMPLPQISWMQTDGERPEQNQPGSTVQVDEQPSLPTRL